jgi:hypothetical protein
MTMPGKATTRSDKIFIDDPQTAETHVARIVILIKGKGVVGVSQPWLK